MKPRHAAQVAVVCIETLGRFIPGARDLRLFELRRNRADHTVSDLILELENIVEHALEPASPMGRAGARIDELAGDANAALSLTPTAFEHVPHAQLAPDLLHIHVSMLVREARITCHDEQPAVSTKALDDYPGKEALMIRVEYPPGASDPVHRHNAHGFIYVLEGNIVMQVRGGKQVALGPGQTFYEGPNDVHTVGRNASQTKPATFIVVLLKDKGAPVLVPAK